MCRRFIPIFCLLLLFGCKQKSVAPPQGALKNVLLISIDTLRPDKLSIYGGKWPTPFFNNFAKRSVVFDHAFTCAPITLTAHTSLLTGLNPPSHGVRNNGTFRAPAHLTLISEIAKQNGLATAAVVGGFPLAAQFGLNQGFDTYDDQFSTLTPPPGTYLYSERSAAEVRAHAEEWLSKHGKQPYFLWLHFFDPHHPYLAHGRKDMGGYEQEVLYVDQQLEQLFGFLRKNKMDEKTLIIVTADHGEAFKEHGEVSHSTFVYNTTLRIPLLISLPGFTPARRNTMARIIDLVPTILEAMHWKGPSSDGVSLLSSMRGDKVQEQYNYGETFAPALDFGWSPLVSIQDLHKKYIQAPKPEFYDLDHDAGEMQNRYDAAKAAPYKAKLTAILSHSAPLENRQPTSEEREKLQAFGYFATSANIPKNPPDPKDMIDVARSIAELTVAPMPLAEKAKAYQRLLVKDINNPVLLLRYAEILLNLNQHPQAEGVYQRVIDLKYPSASAYNGLAAACFYQQKNDRAEQVLKQAVALKVADGETYYNLGEFELNQGNNDQAMQYYDRSMAFGFLPAIFREARLTEVKGDYQRALQILNDAGRKHPEQAQINYQRGMIYFRRQNYRDAVSEFETALKKSPDDKWLFYNIGVTYERAGDHARATSYLQEFLKTAPPQMKQEQAMAKKLLSGNGS